MQITEVRAHALSVPYDEPRWTAHERMERDQLVLVEVRTDQGLIGFGEVAGGPQKLICSYAVPLTALYRRTALGRGA
jgi:L-alanine-DL-glutamate epimerase-like enolase superfamily enzyme